MSYTAFLDTETTGLPRFRNIHAMSQIYNWPDIVSIAWSVYDKNGTLVKSGYSVVKPDGWTIHPDSIKVHKITEERAHAEGRPLKDVMDELKMDLETCDTVVAHHMEFDKNVIFNAYKWRLNMNPLNFWPKDEQCTMLRSTEELRLPSKYADSKKFKPPSLKELYKATFDGQEPTGQHNSQKDVEILCKIYWARWPPS